jgi:hypothetical protein
MSAEPLAGQGHLGYSRRLPGGFTCACAGARSGAGGRAGLRARRSCLWQGQFSERWILGNNILGSLLLLTDNYIQQLRTKPQRHEGTKERAKRFKRHSSLAIHEGNRQQRRASAGPPFAPLGSRLPPVGRAVRDHVALCQTGPYALARVGGLLRISF